MMLIQILGIALSCSGYYFIGKKPRYSYFSFIALNLVLFSQSKQYALLFNIVFAVYFLYKYENENR